MEGQDNTEYCSNCTRELMSIDEEPNGDLPTTCIQCRTEEEIDFDAYPNATVSRLGEVHLGDEEEHLTTEERLAVAEEHILRMKVALEAIYYYGTDGEGFMLASNWSECFPEWDEMKPWDIAEDTLRSIYGSKFGRNQ